MLGERGLWFKRNFFEQSVRVPLVVHAPKRFAPRRCARLVSLVDLLPTLVDLAGSETTPLDLVEAVDGRSLCPLLAGNEEGWDDTVYAEQTSEGTSAPSFMVRRGQFKYIGCELDPPQLFDLTEDPKELKNLSGKAPYAAVELELASALEERWDTKAITREVLSSQRRRLLVNSALGTGRRLRWDFEPPGDAFRHYFRGDTSYDSYFADRDLR